MATYKEATIQQAKSETRKWTFDFTDDLPSGVTVSSGTAVHTPPSGTAATLTIAATTPYVTVQLGGLTVTGVHYLEAMATLSNGEVSSVKLAFTVLYPTLTARSGLADLINELRALTDAGPNDFDIAGEPYWSDKHLQKHLDNNRKDVYREQLEPTQTYNNGTVEYKEYYSSLNNWEQTTDGTAIHRLENAAGTVYGTSLYTADYIRGQFTFTDDTTGSAVFASGRVYDLNAAAADVWRSKAANAAKLYDFATDGHNLKRSQIRAQCLEMAKYYEGMKAPTVISLYRDDMI